MKFTPIHNNLLVKLPEPKEHKTKSGLFLPNASNTTEPMIGEVVKVGAGKINAKGKTIPVDFKPGDKVIFDQHIGVELDMDDNKYLVINETLLLGRVDNEGTN